MNVVKEIKLSIKPSCSYIFVTILLIFRLSGISIDSFMHYQVIFLIFILRHIKYLIRHWYHIFAVNNWFRFENNVFKAVFLPFSLSDLQLLFRISGLMILRNESAVIHKLITLRELLKMAEEILKMKRKWWICKYII